MRRFFYTFTFTCLVVFSFSTQSRAVDSLAANSAFQFLDEPVIPRLVGMGYAGTAFSDGGFSFVNPAQPYLSERPSIQIGYSPMPGDLTVPFFEIAWVFSDFFWGLHGSNYAINNIIPATEQGPDPTNPFSYSFSLASIDAGFTFNRGAVGVTVNSIQERIETSSRLGISVSAGGLYRIIPGKLTGGVAFLNEGTVSAFTYDVDMQGEREKLPRSGRLGFAYTDTIWRFPVNAACDAVYRDVGNGLYSAANIVPRMTMPLGLEIWPTDNVALRVGKRINFETEVVNFGAGLRLSPLTFDMAFVVTQFQGDVEIKPTFGLTYALGAATPGKSAPVQKQPTPPVKPKEMPAVLPKTDSAAIPPAKPLSPAVVPDSVHAVQPKDSSAAKTPAVLDTAHGAPVLPLAPGANSVAPAPKDSLGAPAKVNAAAADSAKSDKPAR